MSNCSLHRNSSAVNQATDTSKSNDIAIAKLVNLPSVIDTLEVGEIGLILIHARLDQRQYNLTLIPEKSFEDFSNLLDNLKQYCLEELAKNPNFRFVVFTFIIVLTVIFKARTQCTDF
jgi:hypothetical protein